MATDIARKPYSEEEIQDVDAAVDDWYVHGYTERLACAAVVSFTCKAVHLATPSNVKQKTASG